MDNIFFQVGNKWFGADDNYVDDIFEQEDTDKITAIKLDEKEINLTYVWVEQAEIDKLLDADEIIIIEEEHELKSYLEGDYSVYQKVDLEELFQLAFGFSPDVRTFHELENALDYDYFAGAIYSQYSVSVFDDYIIIWY